MAGKKEGLKKLVSDARNLDEIVKIFTGRSVKEHLSNMLDLVGEDIATQIKEKVGEENDYPISGPYAVLHARPSYSDAILKYRFRLLVRELHPDTGKHPDPVEYQKVVEAYQEIMDTRKSTSIGEK